MERRNPLAPPIPAMPRGHSVSQALVLVRQRARLRESGLPPPDEEILAYEVERLRTVLDGIAAGRDQAQSDAAADGRQWAACAAKAALNG
jgi:hypothetical protein